MRTHASPTWGHDQEFGGVGFLLRHAAPVANVLWKHGVKCKNMPILTYVLIIGKSTAIHILCR